MELILFILTLVTLLIIGDLFINYTEITILQDLYSLVEKNKITKIKQSEVTKNILVEMNTLYYIISNDKKIHIYYNLLLQHYININVLYSPIGQLLYFTLKIKINKLLTTKP